MFSKKKSLQLRIFCAFEFRGPPDFQISSDLSFDEDLCVAWFVGKHWQDAMPDLLQMLSCFFYFESAVLAYYLPSIAIASLRSRVRGKDWWRFEEFLENQLLPELRLGTTLANDIQRGTTLDQRAALAEWLGWLNETTDEYEKYLASNLEALGVS